jgi:hypothetical protein
VAPAQPRGMPESAQRLVHYERLVAPRDHLAVLVEPDAASIHSWLRNPDAGGAPDTPLLDTTVAAVRESLLRELNLRSPVIACGHQAEFMHAGVFAKSIAAHELARAHGGSPVFLLVDTDVPKSAVVVVPQVTPHGLRRVDVSIPGCDLQAPFAAQNPVARPAWLQFFASLTALYADGDRTMLPTYARGWLTTAATHPPLCDALSRAQQAVETALDLPGIRTLRMTALAATSAFRIFMAFMMLDPHRTAAAYNAAQASYRAAHRVRARGRPVPPLVVDGATVELPLWAIRAGEPRRRLFVTAYDEIVELATDNRRIGALPRAESQRAAFHAGPWRWPARAGNSVRARWRSPASSGCSWPTCSFMV